LGKSRKKRFAQLLGGKEKKGGGASPPSSRRKGGKFGENRERSKKNVRNGEKEFTSCGWKTRREGASTIGRGLATAKTPVTRRRVSNSRKTV